MVIKEKDITLKVNKSISFLTKHQNSNGEFKTRASKNPNMKINQYVKSPFITTFVLHSFNYFKKNTSIEKMKENAIKYLLSDMVSPFLWKFFGKYSNIPPDIDDTSCVLAVLSQNGIEIKDNVIEYLLNLRLDDGSFYTWFIEKNNYRDILSLDLFDIKKNIDWTVNANVLYLFSSLKLDPPKGLCEYLINVIKKKTFLKKSFFYFSPLAFTYMISRAYADGEATCIQKSLDNLTNYLLETQKHDGSWGSVLNTALATISLLNVGYYGEEIDNSISFLLDNQNKNGSWPIYAFCTGYPFDLPYFGSEELTTSFCLECLRKYQFL